MNNTDKILSVSTLLFPSLNSSLEGIAGDLFFRGCKRCCPGCHNEELQTFSEPNKSVQDVINAVKLNNIKILTLMGGEPLDISKPIFLHFLQQLSIECPYLRINLYTGYELDEVDPDVLGYIGSIKTGFYDERNLAKMGSFLVSKNQKYYQRDVNGKFVAVCL